MDEQVVQSLIDELEHYAKAGSDDLTEYWWLLIGLRRKYIDFLPPKLRNVLEKTIQEELKGAKREFRIVSREVTHTYNIVQLEPVGGTKP